MNDTFFTSDEHHGHENARIGWGNEQKARPFSSLEEMTEGLIDNHNSVVKAGDKVYHVGDMFWRTFGVENAISVMSRLNGDHFYVLGNHEELMEHPTWLRAQFVWIKERAKIRPRKDYPSIVLDHYAGRVWDGSHKGNYQLYGHSHGNISEYGLSFDVGVDANDFFPVSLDTVIQRMEQKSAELVFTKRV